MLETYQRLAETLNKRLYQLINVGLNQEMAANNVECLANRLTKGKSLKDLCAIAFCYNRLDMSLQQASRLRNKKLVSSQLMLLDRTFKIRIVDSDRIITSAQTNNHKAINGLVISGPVLKKASAVALTFPRISGQ